jgi:hypothetical protein
MNERPVRSTFRQLSACSAAILAATLVLAGSRAADAHQIWIEQDAKGSKVYFGEYGANLREVSPGRLDKFAGLTAVHQQGAKGERELALVKTGEAFVLGARAARGESLVVQDLSYPIISRKGAASDKAGKPAAQDPAAKAGSAAKPTQTLFTPAARYVADLRPQAPKLALDILPTGQAGQLQVTFRGKPLPDAKVEITAQSGWSLTGETDQAGKVQVTLPWKSGYLVKVHHIDATPGKRKTATGEEAYDTASFVTTLSFVTSDGLRPPAPPAPVKPSELAAN